MFNLIRQCALALLFLCAASWATAQYVWLDENGRKTFSDMPPPKNIPNKNILKTPRDNKVVNMTSIPDAEKNAAEENKTKKTPGSVAEKEVSAKKKKLEDEEKNKKSEEEATQSAQKKDNCSRSQRTLITLESGQRLASVNEKGERGLMGEEQRAQEISHAKKIAAENC